MRNGLMHLYAKYGFLGSAHQLFVGSSERDVVL